MLPELKYAGDSGERSGFSRQVQHGNERSSPAEFSAERWEASKEKVAGEEGLD